MDAKKRETLKWEGESFVYVGTRYWSGRCDGCGRKVKGTLFHYIAHPRLDAYWCQDCVEIVRSYQQWDEYAGVESRAVLVIIKVSED